MKTLLLSLAVMLFIGFAQAENCSAGIIDKAGVIRNTATIAASARPLLNQGVDVRIVTVDHATYAYNGSSLSGVETSLEAACPNFIDSKTGQRKANLYVIMVAPQDHQKNIFLGSYYAGSFDIPSTYSQFANTSFKARQWETGIANTLNGTGSRAIAYHAQQFATQQRQRVVPVQPRVYTSATPVYTSTPQSADRGMSGLTIFLIVIFILSAVGVALYFTFRSPSKDSTAYDEFSSPSAATSYSSGRSIGYGGRRITTAPPSNTTVINNSSSNDGFVTGVVVGEMMNRPNYNPVYVAPPVYVEPQVEPQVSLVGVNVTDDRESAPVADAPDSTWEESAQQDTSQDTTSNDSGF